MFKSDPASVKSKMLRVPEIRFLREQDGPPERLLKSSLTEFFLKYGEISRAYLALVDLGGNQNPNVVLGLTTMWGDQREIVARVGAIFAGLFNGAEHLDIIFLTGQQEDRLKTVCKPFYEQAKR